MGVWGLEAEIAGLAFALVVPLGLLPAVHAIYRRFGALRLLPSAILAGATLYGLALVAFTSFPIPADAADACTRAAAGWRLSPFASVREAADVAREVGS